MKKILTIILFGLPLLASAQLTVPAGGTGTTTFPTDYVLVGNSALRVTAKPASQLGIPSFSTTSANYFMQGIKDPFTAASFQATSTATSTSAGAWNLAKGFASNFVETLKLWLGNGTASTTLSYDGAATTTLTSALDSTGLSTSNGLIITGGGLINTVAGTSTKLTGNAYIGGNLEVAGNLFQPITFTGGAMNATTLTVTGQTTLATSLTGYLKAASGVISSQAVPIPVADGGTNATSFTTSGHSVYWNGTSLLTAPLTSTVVTPYASTTMLTTSAGATFATVSGNVGIGTTSPTQLFVVESSATNAAVFSSTAGNATVRLSSQSGGDAQLVFAEGLASRWTIYNDGDDSDKLKFLDSGGQDNLTIQTDGNVGIGTTVPRGKLEVVSGTANTGTVDAATITGANSLMSSTVGNLTVTSNTAQAADIGGGIVFGGRYINSDVGEATWAAIKSGKTNGTTGEYGGYLAFGTRTTGDGLGIVEKMRILDTGNVGIGTTGPANILDIQKDTTDFAGAEGTWGVRLSDGAADTALMFAVNATANAAAIQAMDPGTSWTTRALSLQPNGGNVGIGTTTPGAKLDIAGGSTVLNILDTGTSYVMTRYRPANNTASEAYFGVEGNSVALITGGGGIANAAVISRQGSYPIQFGTNNVVRMTVASGGNVGIGTTSPSAKLGVKGSGTGTGRMIAFSDSADLEKLTILDNGALRLSTTTQDKPAAFAMDANGRLTVASSTAASTNSLSFGKGSGILIPECPVAYAATISIPANCNQVNITLTGNATIVFDNNFDGKTVRIVAYQDGTGGRKITAWPAGIDWINSSGAATTAPSMSTKPWTSNVFNLFASQQAVGTTTNGIQWHGTSGFGY